MCTLWNKLLVPSASYLNIQWILVYFHSQRDSLNMFSGFWCPTYSLDHVNVIHQLKKMEESHQEATEKEVERILGCLKSYYQDDREYISSMGFHHHCLNDQLLMCVCLYHSNIADLVLWVCHWPRLVFADGGEHFPHVFSDQGERRAVVHFILFSSWVCVPSGDISRRDSVVCVSGWFGTDVSGWWQIALYR